jgi:hypothetical protein
VRAGSHAFYVDVDGWCVGIVAPGAARVPCAARVTDMWTVGAPLAGDPPSAYLEGGTLHVGGRPLMISRLVGTSIPPLDVGALRETSPATVEATPPATVAGFLADHVPHGQVDAAVAADLLGRGEGLTPLGDDVLAGWLATHRAARVTTPEVDAVVAGARSRTTLLSATLLDCARHGEVLPEHAAWVRALGTPAEPAAADDLARVGATSGAGLLAGSRLALRGLLDRQREAA